MINFMTQSYFLAFTGGQSYKSDDKFPILKKYLIHHGILQTDKFDTNLYISVNHNSSLLKSFMKSKSRNKITILIRLEPFVVFPAQYSKIVEEKYTLIVTPGSTRDFISSNFFIGWPHSFQENPANPETNSTSDHFQSEGQSNDKLFEFWKKRKIVCSMIAANKVSPIANTNYTLRRHIAMDSSPDLLEVFGPLWNESLYRKIVHRSKVAFFNIRHRTNISFESIYGDLFKKYKTTKGFTKDKYSILKESKFSLVVENCMDYVSEKLFDAIYAGSVPIYVGPKLTDVGLPSNIAFQIDRCSINTLTSILNMEDENVSTYLDAGQKFLKGNQYNDIWTEESVYAKIANKIVDQVEGRKCN